MPRTRTRRTQVILWSALAVGVLLVSGLLVHGHQVRDADASLRRTGNDLRSQLQTYEREQHEVPATLRLREDSAVLTGTAKTLTNTTDVEAGTSLDWYVGVPDPRITTTESEKEPGFAFCLDRGGRHWRLNASADSVATQGAGGPCPPAPRP